MTNIELTLAEQMQLSEREIEQRKALIDFDDKDAKILRHYKEFIAEHVDDIVEQFYAKQVQVPENALLIGDAETMRLLRSAMRRYILELFEGDYGSDYVNRRLRI